VVIAHELEHVVWCDPQVLAALQFMKRAMPWQPLLSLALVSYVEAAEEACDAAAIRSTGDARTVAHVLLRLAPVHRPAVAFSNLNSGRSIRQRIERIVAAPSTMRRGSLAGVTLVATLLLLSAALPHVATPRKEEAPVVEMRVEVIGEPR
jgi:beta-lactamase regulating signal transducer with metallopeptidase domain